MTATDSHRETIRPVERSDSEDWTSHALFYEYSKAADPIRGGQTTPMPPKQFSAEINAGGDARLGPLDLFAFLRTDSPASSPALLANYLVIRAGDPFSTDPNAASQLSSC